MPKIIVRGEQERFWLALDQARKTLSSDRVDPAVNALWAAVAGARMDPAAALAIVLVATANFSADVLMAIEGASPITNPGGDDRLRAIPQYFKQLLEATTNDRKARRMMARATQAQGHA